VNGEYRGSGFIRSLQRLRSLFLQASRSGEAFHKLWMVRVSLAPDSGFIRVPFGFYSWKFGLHSRQHYRIYLIFSNLRGYFRALIPSNPYLICI
jgi:hypothetical protein